MIHVPVLEEVVTLDRHEVTTDAVRIRTSVEERNVLVEDVLDRGTFRIDRVATDRPVAVAPPPRSEGDVTIISLVEERLVVEKRLFVVEEVHVTRERTLEQVAIPVTLRATRASIEHPTTETSNGRDTDG